jgi:hypothetical protein
VAVAQLILVGPMSLATPIIAALALAVSLALLIVHYRNQLERRHAEITQLRTQIITGLSSIQQRITSLLLNGEIVRIELRRLPDTDDKWQSIERLPGLLASAKELKDDLAQALKQFERMNTRKSNRSATLLRLQSQAAGIPRIVAKAEFVEKDMLSLLTDVREEGEA